MRLIAVAFAALVAWACMLSPSQAALVVTIDKTSQTLTVDVDGVTAHKWPVSTARWGYSTPNGRYRPEWLARKWFSRQYDWSPMPYSVFFHGGYAVHGSYEIARLGRPASHGCIRLHPDNAKVLFGLVQKFGKANTTIVVTGSAPPRPPVVRTPRPPRAEPEATVSPPPPVSSTDFLRLHMEQRERSY